MARLGLTFSLLAAFSPTAMSRLSQIEPQLQYSTEGQAVPAFVSFIAKYGRTYQHGTREYERRLDIFSRRLAEVKAQNDMADRRWTADVNTLSDRTDDELAQLRGWRGGVVPGNKRKAPTVRAGATFLKQATKAVVLPRQFTNWTRLASLSPVRDQGACGSCWAVASGTMLDAHSEIHSPQDGRRSFSVQDLVSCVPNPHACGGTGGCEGATVELALDYAINYGLETSETSPYNASNGICKNKIGKTSVALSMGTGAKGNGEDTVDVAAQGMHFAATEPAPAVGMKAWERLPENAYEPLLRAVYERGPVAVSVSAKGWFSYSNGIFDGCLKDAVIDHAVTLIGFGEETHKFWLIQNSWGPNWGVDGRIRLLRQDGEEQHCGTDRQPEVGTGCKGGPAEVRVCGMCGILYDNAVPHFA
mmetsp:Transcript_138730/g.276661  ORF Transcript_138730/g.276661 Transcript_138730/m.276661 type:complete len:417 (+) Transcript_138730:73-1323(+)